MMVGWWGYLDVDVGRMTKIEESRVVDIQFRSLPLRSIHQLTQLIIQNLIRPLERSRTRDFVGERPKINQGAAGKKIMLICDAAL